MHYFQYFACNIQQSRSFSVLNEAILLRRSDNQPLLEKFSKANCNLTSL